MSFPGRALQRAWHLVDAKDQTVGRLATVVAPILRGKHKPTYAPHQDVGDYVVIVNADKVQFTGNKWQGTCGNHDYTRLFSGYVCLFHMSSHACSISLPSTFRGARLTDKLYRWHTGYPGGLKQRKAADMLERKPEEILKKAILGMMRRTNQRHKYIEPRLKIYAGEDHPHKAQLPDGVQGLPPHPRSRSGDHHFGLADKYASEGSYQKGAGQSD